MVICWLIHTAEDWSLHVARLRCNIFILTFLKILCEHMEVNEVEKQRPALLWGRGCSSALLHCWLPVICFLSWGFLPFHGSIFFVFNPWADTTISRVSNLCFYFSYLYGFSLCIFSYHKKIFWAILRQGHRLVLYQTKLWITENWTSSLRVAELAREGNWAISFCSHNEF